MKKLINPALAELSFLVGDWDMELSNASFLPDPKERVMGHASFDVIEDGALLVMRQNWAAVWVIGRDQDQEDYEVLYFDDRKVSRVYKMSFKDTNWKLWRENSTFSQRFVGKVSADKKTIKAYWEKSTDNKTWHHDFDMEFTKKS